MSLLLPHNLENLRKISYECLRQLSSEEGIYASSKEEAYGCIFGRDSAITILKLLNVYSKTKEKSILDICRRTLFTLISLQGKEYNPQSGEEPGKFIHEFRRDNYQRLTVRKNPWYVYPDGFLRNYDSLDSTPLILIAIYRYWQATKDADFLLKTLPAVEKGLEWIVNHADKDKDYLMEYSIPSARTHGGLVVHSWTDSAETLLGVDGKFPLYPIAPVEVQGVAWLSLKLWTHFYSISNKELAGKLEFFEKNLKTSFNKNFIIEDSSLKFAAQALDGNKSKIATITANPLICLWASFAEEDKKESILDEELISSFVKRAFMKDMFDKDAGIRTMSLLSPTYNAGKTSYHNGSFWPMLNGLIYEGLRTWNYFEEAEKLMEATLKPISHFGFPIELYIKTEATNDYLEYESPNGKKGCKYQAWTAAAILDLTTASIGQVEL